MVIWQNPISLLREYFTLREGRGVFLFRRGKIGFAFWEAHSGCRELSGARAIEFEVGEEAGRQFQGTDPA